jgi:acyl-coenzyme A synthetase/AMP-(fatty) acid ligase
MYQLETSRPMIAPHSIPQRFNAATFFLDRHLHEGRGGRTAFRYRGRSLTYQETCARANRVGNALRARGVQIEQRVLLVLPDYPEFAQSFWGAMRLTTSTGKIQRFQLRRER